MIVLVKLVDLVMYWLQEKFPEVKYGSSKTINYVKVYPIIERDCGCASCGGVSMFLLDKPQPKIVIDHDLHRVVLDFEDPECFEKLYSCLRREFDA